MAVDAASPVPPPTANAGYAGYGPTFAPGSIARDAAIVSLAQLRPVVRPRVTGTIVLPPGAAVRSARFALASTATNERRRKSRLGPKPPGAAPPPTFRGFGIVLLANDAGVSHAETLFTQPDGRLVFEHLSPGTSR